MIARGVDPDNLRTEDKLALLRLWQAGIIGWPAESLSRWRVAAILLSIRGVVVQAAGGKAEKPLTLTQFEPEIKELIDDFEEVSGDLSSQADRLIASLMAAK